MTHGRCVSSWDCSTSGRTERAVPQRSYRLHLNTCCWGTWSGAGRPRARVCAAGSYTDAPAAQQQVVALTWEEAVHLQQAQQEQMEDWWGEPAEAAARARAAPAVEGSAVRPLKINLDLLLYRARLARRAAFQAGSLSAKLAHQREAEALLRRCLSLDPTDGRGYVGLGKLLLQQRRCEEARKLYDEGTMATEGQNEFIWQAWATLEARVGNVAKARKLYDAAIVANGSHAAAWHGWGLLEKRQGNPLRARDLWVKGVRAAGDRGNPHLYQALGVLAAETGFTDEARRWFSEGTRRLPGAKSSALWHAWAEMERRQGEAGAVRFLLRKGLEANPRSRYVYLSWALWEKKQGQLDDARRLFERGCKLNPSDTALLQAWAVLEAERGNTDHARNLLRTASEKDPCDLYIWQTWGVLEARAGSLARARELFQQGVWAQPGSCNVSRVWQAWAVLEAADGNTQLARQLFRCAVKADPSSEPSWLAWAQLEEKEGALQRADELRNFRMQERTELVLPASFAAGFDPVQQREAPFQSIIATMSDWLAKFDNMRAVARRPPPSYLRTTEGGRPAAGALEGSLAPELPPLEEMARLDAAAAVLDLPDLAQGRSRVARDV